jgi:formylglycine-generating enzyme required for sulfatase activity
MAPEQIRGLSDLDQRVDVYALGVLLYTLLAGKEPFIGDTVYTITHAVLNEPVPDLRRTNPNVSAAVMGIIRKSMAKDRKQRYATMDDMQRDLEAVAQGARPVHVGVIAADQAPTAVPPTAAARSAAVGGGGLGGLGGGFSVPGLGLIVRVLLIAAVIVVPLTLLPKLLERRGAPAAGAAGGKRVAPGQDAHGPYCTIHAAGNAFVLRWCPPGGFRMGSEPGEPGRAPWETPHQVSFAAGCWMLESEVSQAQYQALVGSAHAKHPGPGLPMDNVTLAEAEGFLAKLNQSVMGLNARLPSEAEWEYACRAGRSTPFSTPPAQEQLLTNAEVLAAWDKQPIDGAPNYDALLSALRWVDNGQTQLGPRAIADGAPNPWGIADLPGNVQEWCRDRWDHRSGYEVDEASDPVANAGLLAVVRGGSWAHPAERARSASRDAQDPETAWPWIGFRFVVPGGAKPEPLPTGE